MQAYAGPQAPYGVYGTTSQYGAAGKYASDMLPSGAKSPFVRGRKGFSAIALAVNLFVPWVLFTTVTASMTFSIRYHSPSMAVAIGLLAAAFVLTMGYFAVQTWRSGGEGSGQDPALYGCLFLASLIALVLALILGDENFQSNMLPVFEISNLNAYSAVDPSTYRGQQLMDAGRINFVPGARLDLSKAMGFKNMDMYCVAPVVANSTAADSVSYDFWAVGTNCCSGHGSDFHCGEYSNPLAQSGLRLMHAAQRPFFQLAVQQAEAAFNIQALHPVFVHWMQDPMAEISAFQDDGYKFFLLSIVGYAGFQVLFVVASVVLLAKLTV